MGHSFRLQSITGGNYSPLEIRHLVTLYPWLIVESNDAMHLSFPFTPEPMKCYCPFCVVLSTSLNRVLKIQSLCCLTAGLASHSCCHSFYVLIDCVFFGLKSQINPFSLKQLLVRISYQTTTKK